MKLWFQKLWVRLRGRKTPAPRPYSMGGWVRGEDGVYRRDGKDAIYRQGRTWYRDEPTAGEDGGVFLSAVPYRSLHAAIKQERTEAAAPLLEQEGQNG